MVNFAHKKFLQQVGQFLLAYCLSILIKFGFIHQC